MGKEESSTNDRSPWAITWRCLRDPTFSRFDTIPACDRHTHTQRERERERERQTHDDG